MEKDEKNIENIEEFADFEETSQDASMGSMFSDDLIEENEITQEIAEETIENTEEVSEEISEEIVKDIAEDSIATAQNDETLFEETIEETAEENSITKIEEYKPQENYVTTADDFEQAPEGEKMITVRPVKFQEFEQTPPNRSIKKNLDILQDVSMHISVELGRTKSSIREVMEMEQGSIVELDKIAGEQVEIFVNEKLVAKGEVIVIEDKFGVRVTSTSIAKNIT